MVGLGVAQWGVLNAAIIQWLLEHGGNPQVRLAEAIEVAVTKSTLSDLVASGRMFGYQLNRHWPNTITLLLNEIDQCLGSQSRRVIR